MASTSIHIAIIIIVALIGYTVQVDGNYSYTELRRRICNGQTYGILDDPYFEPDTLTSMIVEKTPTAPNFKFYITFDIFYGRGSCSNSLDADGCHFCMRSAYNQLFDECSRRSVGAQIELNDCALRYETYYF